MNESRIGDWIQTYSGRQFWPRDPRAEDVCIEDIAHALSMKCRYAGHCQRFYSVAEHSVLVSLHAPSQHALWGLLHDAAEAYSADIPRPLKVTLPHWSEIEDRIMAAVCDAFGLARAEPAEVKMVDTAILADEQQAIMAPPPVAWKLPYPPVGATIRALSPAQAKSAFLQRFYDLTRAPI